MADSLVVGRLRAILGMDTAQYEAGARKAVQTNEKLTQEFKKTAQQMSVLQGVQQKLTFKDMIAGMSAANPNMVASARLIQGMSAAGQQAAAAQLAAAQASQTWTQRLQGFVSQSGLATRASLAFGLAIGAGAIVNAARSFGEFAGKMVDLSAETGIGTERLQALNFIAAGAGVTIDELAGAVNQLSRRLESGDTGAIKAVQRLGLSVQQLQAMSPDRRFIALAEAISRVENPAERVRLAFETMGRTGTRMLRVMTEDIGRMVEEVEKSDAVIKDAFIQRADEVADAWDQMLLRIRANALNTVGLVMAAFSATQSVMQGAAAGGAVGTAKAGGGGPTPAEQAATLQSEIDKQLKSILPPANPALQSLNLLAGVGPTGADIERLRKQVEFIEGREKREKEHAQRQLELVRESNERAAELERARIATVEAMRRMEEEGYREQLRRQTAELDRAGVAAAEIESARQADIAARTRMEADAHDAFMAQSEARNEIGLSFMDADRRRLEEQQQLIDELRDRWLMFADDMTFAVTNGFADMLTGLRSFKDSMIDIWRSIRQAIANILSQMLADFIGGYIRKAVAAMAGAAVAGGAGSAVAGGLGAGAGAAAGGGAGIGATLAGLASNPLTWAAAAGIGLGVLVGKTGLFRGGEEGTKVNPRRDQFIGQFGPSGTGPGSGYMNLFTQLRSQQLFGALTRADTVEEFEAAQAAIVSRFAMMRRQVKSFNLGGFVPPGVVQPAILHGGSRGEIVMPLDKMAQGRTPVVNITNNFDGVIDRDSFRVFMREQMIPEIRSSLVYNTGGLKTHIRKAVR